jgi:hypothetical protein
VRVFGDLVVFLDTATVPARTGRRGSMSARGTSTRATRRSSPAAPPTSPTCCLSGTPRGWPASGCGPGAIPDDLAAITRGLVPELQRRGAFRTGYDAGSLRGLLGLPRPASRYAAATGGN